MHGAAQPLRVLVVDDSSVLRRQVCHALERSCGMAAVEAGDGAAAWRRLTEARFDLVVTDINMPVLDGLKLVALVRGSEGPNRKVPIVVITTESAQADRDRALALGASAFLVKPVLAPQVVEAARQLLGR
jgi:two-component system chemotaxis response regulator CheY